jgi:uncharacterized protein
VRWKGQADSRFGQALLSCHVSMPANGLDSCELRLTDWGTRDQSRPERLFDDVALGDELSIEFGEEPAGTVFQGYITAIEARLGGGAPQLSLLAEDALQKLARQRQSKVYERMSVADVVAALAGSANLSPDCDEATVGTWNQLNETDLGFLRRIAGGFNLPIRLVDGRTLRVKSAEGEGEPIGIDIATAPASSLRLIADLNRQPALYTAAGYDLASGQAISSDARSLTPAPSGTTAASKLAELGWDGPWRAVQPAPASQAQASAYAKAAFARRAGHFVHGEMVAEGDPRFAPGRALRLTNAGERFDGDYAIVACSHRFDLQGGYRALLRLGRGGLA